MRISILLESVKYCVVILSVRGKCKEEEETRATQGRNVARNVMKGLVKTRDASTGAAGGLHERVHQYPNHHNLVVELWCSINMGS